jgi:hypothetical protein
MTGNMTRGGEKPIHRLLRVAGYILVALAFYYVIRMLWLQRASIVDWQPTPFDIGIVTISILAYGLMGFLLTIAWCRLNHVCGQGPMQSRHCAAIYGTTQIAKYIPGNVFHFIGRHAAGVRAGLSHATLACSATLEMTGLLFSAGVLSLPGILLFSVERLAFLPRSMLIYVLVIVAIFVGVLSALPWILDKLSLQRAREAGRISVSALLPAVLLQLLFFASCGLLTGMVTYAVIPGAEATASSILLAASAYPVGWLAGYVVPGASAGIGVREATIMLIMSSAVSAGDATLIAVLMRLVTMAGDMLFYLFTRSHALNPTAD